MGVIAQYQVSASNPSTVGGTSGVIQYFSSNPPQSLWNSGVTGVNAPLSSAQLGGTPSSTSALGQLSFDTVAFKLNGSRFKMVASGYASTTTGTPTLTAAVYYNSGTIASPSYAALLGNVASNATVANKPVAWSLVGDLYFDPTSGTISGFQEYTYANASGGGSDKTQIWVALTSVTGVTAGGIYATQSGFVVGVTFSAGTTGNSASLTEFKIIQD